MTNSRIVLRKHEQATVVEMFNNNCAVVLRRQDGSTATVHYANIEPHPDAEAWKLARPEDVALTEVRDDILAPWEDSPGDPPAPPKPKAAAPPPVPKVKVKDKPARPAAPPEQPIDDFLDGEQVHYVVVPTAMVRRMPYAFQEQFVAMLSELQDSFNRTPRSKLY